MDTEEIRVMLGITSIVFGTILLVVGAYGFYRVRKAEKNK